MKFGRFLDGARSRWGVLEDSTLFDLESAPWTHHVRGRGRLLESVKLLAPIDQGNKVIGLAQGYAPRGERDGPGVFIKPPTSVIGHMDTIVLPRIAERVIYEVELGVVIGKQGKNIPKTEAKAYVFGYTCVNDVTATRMTTKDGPPTTRSKSFDTFCPMGPLIATDVDGGNAQIRSRLNGVLKHDSSSSLLTWSIEEIIEWVSRIMTLYPGDIISTSTPSVVDPINAGDVVECEIGGVGVLRNGVTRET